MVKLAVMNTLTAITPMGPPIATATEMIMVGTAVELVSGPPAVSGEMEAMVGLMMDSARPIRVLSGHKQCHRLREGYLHLPMEHGMRHTRGGIKNEMNGVGIVRVELGGLPMAREAG